MTIHITTEEDKGICLIEKAREEGRLQGLIDAADIAMNSYKLFIAEANKTEGVEKLEWLMCSGTAKGIYHKILKSVNHGSQMQDSPTRTDNKETTL